MFLGQVFHDTETIFHSVNLCKIWLLKMLILYYIFFVFKHIRTMLEICVIT